VWQGRLHTHDRPGEPFPAEPGQDSLTEYVFNTGVAKHLFCRVCGVKAFYRPRSNPDGWSVNARCMDAPVALNLSEFDGQNWEANAGHLSHLSQEQP